MLKNLLSNLSNNYNIILANGEFPDTPDFIVLLKNAKNIISCDGSIKHLIEHNIQPTIIIGDCDSLTKDNLIKFKDKTLKITDQDSNDLSKAVNWAHKQNLDNIIILAATGLREDHTLANISLLSEYSNRFKHVLMLSIYGIFTVHSGKDLISTQKGQQISFFAVQNNTQISANELKWPLKDFILKNWYCGTLNEATSNQLNINCTNSVIVYRSFELKSSNN